MGARPMATAQAAAMLWPQRRRRRRAVRCVAEVAEVAVGSQVGLLERHRHAFG